MFNNEPLPYICGHYKKRASKTYDSRQHPRERSKTEILTTINPLLLFFSYLAALLDHTEKYPGTQYTRMDDLNINSFNALYTLYYRKSFLFAKSYIHDEQVAEDIAAEALIKLWEKLKTDIINSPQAMLLTILKNKSLDYLRLEQNKLNAMSELSELYWTFVYPAWKLVTRQRFFPKKLTKLSKPPYAHSRNKPEESLK